MEARSKPFNAVLFFMLCLLHQVHIGSSNTLQCVMPVVSSMYSLAALLRTPGYFVRLLRVLPHAVSEALIFVDVLATGASAPFDIEVARSQNEKFLLSCGVDTSDPSAQRLLDVLNFPWHLDMLIHHCANRRCCKDRQHCVIRIADIFASTAAILSTKTTLQKPPGIWNHNFIRHQEASPKLH
jgi:hypothetical protein